MNTQERASLERRSRDDKHGHVATQEDDGFARFFELCFIHIQHIIMFIPFFRYCQPLASLSLHR